MRNMLWRWSLAKVSARVKGEKAVARKLATLSRVIPSETAAALYQEALQITKWSMARTPRQFGALRDSHEVSAPRWRGKTLQVDIQVGGPTAPYAKIVHERTDLRHRPPYGQGGQAKFLESALLDATPGLRQRIAKRIKMNRLG